MHPPIGRGVSRGFKSSNRIKISRLVQISLHFYWFRAPHTPGGWGGWSGCLGGWRWCGDLLDDVGIVQISLHFYWFRAPHTPGGWGGWSGCLGGWRWCGDLLDDVGMTGMTWGWRGWCGDNGDDMGMTGMTWGPRGQHGVETTETTAMETTWGPSGGYGDNVGTARMKWGWRGMMGMMWGPWGPCGDNKITKNAITFEWIEIIEFCLKIWDPWAPPPHTYTAFDL